MKILIVEDDNPKARNIERFLSKNIANSTIKVAHSYRSGIGQLMDWSPNLVILDMTMPTYDGIDESGGKPKVFGGKEVLAQMERFGLSIPVIVVTQFETFGHGKYAINLDELDKILEKKFSDIYIGSVYYHAAIGGWKENLLSMIKRIDTKNL